MKKKTLIPMIISGILLSTAAFIFRPLDIPAPLEVEPSEDRSDCVVTSPPESYGFDPFYAKYCDANGIPVISSAKVDDLALQQAYYIINNMLAATPYVREELVRIGVYFAVIGKHQRISTLPEYEWVETDYRGLGAKWNVRITSAGEENLLCLTWERYYGESIAAHEFAHTVHLLGLGNTIPGFNLRLRLLYLRARLVGLWDDTYAGENYEEYWAEGLQSYFSTNLEIDPPDGVHNHVNTPEELAAYDPHLFALIDSIYGGYDWAVACPGE